MASVGCLVGVMLAPLLGSVAVEVGAVPPVPPLDVLHGDPHPLVLPHGGELPVRERQTLQ